MTTEEQIAKAVADSVARTKAADEEALLAAEAFVYGVFDKYYAARVKDIERRIDQHFGTTGNGGTPLLADPADLGRPVE